MECTRCQASPARPGQRWCLACHAAWMRLHRPRHRALSEPERLKANARSYANVYKRRGKLVPPQACERCAKGPQHMHHEDYGQPLLVTWLCRPCHSALHKA